MKILRPIFILLLFNRISVPIYADNNAEEILNKMEAAERNIQDARFHFEQKITFNVTGETKTVKGEAKFRQPNKIFVQIAEPFEQTAVSDGKVLWVYVKERRQVIKDKWSNWSRTVNFPEGMAPFSANAAAFRKKFRCDLEEAERTGAAPEYFILRLVPKKAGKAGPDYTLRVWVSPETYYIGRSELVTDGSKIEISIVDFKTNTGIAPETFRFTPPAGTEIINLLR